MNNTFPSYDAWRAVTEPTASAFNGGLPRASARLCLLSFNKRAEERATYGNPWLNMVLQGWTYPFSATDTGDIIRVYQEMKGPEHPELLSWGGMTGLTFEHHDPFGRCNFNDGSAYSRVYSTPLLVLKAAAGAVVEEVCPADPAEFDESLERLAEVASGLKTHFLLSAPADGAAPISVLVDGVSVPSGVWTFNALRNEIRFQLADAPASGRMVTVQYLTKPPP